MKNLIISSVAFLLLLGCSGGSGGVLTDNSDSGTSSGGGGGIAVATPTPIPAGSFDATKSSFTLISNQTDVTNKSVAVSDTVTLTLTAKDSSGNLKSGLKVQFTHNINPTTTTVDAAETSTGVYTYSIKLTNIGPVSFKTLVNSVDASLSNYVNVSACNNLADSTATPFHSNYSIGGKNAKVVCLPSEFAAMSLPANSALTFIINADIDFTDYYKTNPQFKIGSTTTPFTGTIYGFQYSIKNFRYVASTEDNVGIFGVLGDGATIFTMNTVNSVIQGNNNVGTIGSIINVNSAVTLSGLNINQSLITSSGNRAGSLIGSSDSVKSVNISNLSLTGVISINPTQTQTSLGGVIGYANNVIITNPSVSVTQNISDGGFQVVNVGGVIGEALNSSITGGYLTINQTYKNAAVIGGVIGKATQTTIGTCPSISVTINQSGASGITYAGGLIGQLDTGTITASSAYVIGLQLNSEFGGIVSKVRASDISNMFIGGTLNVVSSGLYLGGISAESTGTNYTKNNSYISMNTSVSNAQVGGLIGSSGSDIISRSSSSGSITAANSYAGGLMGSSVNSSVSNSYSQAQISGATTGGLIGISSGTGISNSYSAGTLSGSQKVGGLIGSNSNGSIAASFSTSPVSASSSGISGALIGTNSSASASMSNVFYLDSGTAACGTDSNGNCSGTPETSINYFYVSSNSPMNIWDFNNIWNGSSTISLPSLR